MIEDAPFFELSLTDSGGRQIAPQRFRTVQDAMTAADGSIEVGDGVPDDDEEWEDDPWTEAEIEHNFRVSREIEDRRALGLSTRWEDLPCNSPDERAAFHARVEAEKAARSDG